jgi:hypothetical protein
MWHLISLAIICASIACPYGSPADKPADWGAAQYLIGDWIGEGGGAPGQGGGSFSFKPDVQGKILVRKNRAEYPASKDRAAFVHEDLMIVYRDTPEASPRAIYFDSEGHTIQYEVQAPPDGHAVVFVSAAEPSAPRYRLTYTRVDQDHLKIKFEIAPAGHPEQFASYIEASARRN